MYAILILFNVYLILVKAEICEDMDSAACTRLISLRPNMCSDHCTANICKRTCNKCPLKCFTCTDIGNPSNCTSSTQCSTTDHKCIAAKTFTADFRTVYRLGCAPNSVCSSGGVSCCSNDFCNNVTSPTRRQTEEEQYDSKIAAKKAAGTIARCADIDNLACTLLLTSNNQVCSDQCVSDSICPVMCGKCSTCYECEHVSTSEQCNSTKQCDPGHVCFGMETLNFNLEHGYKLGCVHQNVCDALSRQVGNIFGKRAGPIEVTMSGGCCHGDLCNHHKLVASTPKSTSPPVTTPPTLSPACQYHECPSKFDKEQGKCYLAGDNALTWEEGKRFCESRCSRLAEFSSESEIRDVLFHIHIHSIRDHHHFGSRHPTVFVGAVDPTHTHSWTWNSSRTAIPSSLFAAGSYTHGHYCAATNRDVHSLVSVDCTSSYQPLCQADVKYHA